MEEILQDINEFSFYGLKGSIFIISLCLIWTYIIRPRDSTKTWWKHWKPLAVVFIIFWLIWSSNTMGSFVSKENFNSLVKMEGILQYNDDDGLYLPLTETIPEEKYKLKFDLLDDEKNLLQFKDEFVTVRESNDFVYQLEHNGKIIYSLEQSNSKVLGAKKNFNSLHKIEGILQYNDDEGFYMIEPPQVKEKHFYILVRLLDTFDNVSAKYENQFVTIWKKNHIAYQLEYNGDVIYSLERSNSKVWLYVIYQVIRYYFHSFFWLMFCYFAFIRGVKTFFYD